MPAAGGFAIDRSLAAGVDCAEVLTLDPDPGRNVGARMRDLPIYRRSVVGGLSEGAHEKGGEAQSLAAFDLPADPCAIGVETGRGPQK